MAMGATPAEKKPTKNRDILCPRNRMLANRAVGSGRICNGDAARDTIDADV